MKNIIDNDMAVYAVHRLDAHPQIGNNILIAQALNLTPVGGCFEHAGKQIGVLAEAPKANIRT
ncbi:MAG: Nif3-like dinuclear metal center hexameric protein [Bacilli bacterium]